MCSPFKKKLLKSTPEYKNHKKRFQAGYFPSKSRKKKSKKSKIPDSIEGSGSVTAECWFANQSHNWGDNGCFKFKTNRPSSAYVIKDIYGNSVGSGTTNGDTNQENQLCFTIRDGSNYSLFIDGSFACDKSPNVPAMKASNCRVDQTSLPPTGTTKFRADLTSCNSSACTYYLKKDGITVKNATYGSNIEPDITGPGTYTLHLLSEDATSACSVTITEVSPATNCQFANATYTYGEDAYFKTKVTASNASWSIRDPNGNVVHSGGGLNQNNQDWQTNFRAKIGGEYTFYLNDQKACTANLNLNMPKATNCRFDNSNISSGANTEFRFKIEYCKNSLCSYVVKLGSTTIDSQNNTGEGDRNKNVNMAGEYVVWLNGVETDCKATLTVGGNSGGSGSEFSCSSDNSISLGTLQGIDNAPNIAGNLNSNECYSLTLNGKSYSASLQIGNWSKNAVNVSFKDCNGNLQTTEVPSSDGWYAYSISAPAGGNCTIYLLSTSGGNVQFNHW